MIFTSFRWVATSNIWPETICIDCAIDITATEREAGVVTNRAGIAMRRFYMIDFDDEYLLGRICCCRIIVPRTFEVQTPLIHGKRSLQCPFLEVGLMSPQCMHPVCVSNPSN